MDFFFLFFFSTAGTTLRSHVKSSALHIMEESVPPSLPHFYYLILEHDSFLVSAEAKHPAIELFLRVHLLHVFKPWGRGHAKSLIFSLLSDWRRHNSAFPWCRPIRSCQTNQLQVVCVSACVSEWLCVRVSVRACVHACVLLLLRTGTVISLESS